RDRASGRKSECPWKCWICRDRRARAEGGCPSRQFCGEWWRCDSYSLVPRVADSPQERLHFSGCADGDSNESWTHVARTIAQQDTLALQFGEKRRPGRPEVGEEKISGAGESNDAEILESLRERLACELDTPDVGADG